MHIELLILIWNHDVLTDDPIKGKCDTGWKNLSDDISQDLFCLTFSNNEVLNN